jgi:cell wall-associated NlpC family hydrolase
MKGTESRGTKSPRLASRDKAMKGQRPKDYSKYLFYRYKANGRGEDGCVDCYGLFLLIEKEMFGRELPDINGYKCQDREDLNRNLLRSLIEYPARRIEEGKEGCGVIMECGGMGESPLDSHIGVYIGEGKVIHASEKRNVVIESVEEAHLKGKLKYYEIVCV